MHTLTLTDDHLDLLVTAATDWHLLASPTTAAFAGSRALWVSRPCSVACIHSPTSNQTWGSNSSAYLAEGSSSARSMPADAAATVCRSLICSRMSSICASRKRPL